MKNLSLYGFLTICFKGRDETEADNCIRKILWQDEYYMYQTRKCKNAQ